MSRVTILTVNPGDVNDRATLNTTFDTWDAATAVVDETNVRPEGIDRRNIDFQTDIFHYFKQASFPGGLVLAYGTTADQTYTGAPVGTPYQTATFDLSNHQASSRIARASFHVRAGSGSGSVGRVGIKARLLEWTGSAWSYVGASADATERRLQSGGAGSRVSGTIFLIGPLSSSATKVGIDAAILQTAGSPTITMEDIVINVDGYN
jgi:hypothetical protein|tara:strand:+ start:3410 stop:4030 length:621 start_codon:yes stop_codon:yes gene_type:complete